MIDTTKPVTFCCSRGAGPKPPWAIVAQDGAHYLYHFRTGYQLKLRHYDPKKKRDKRIESALKYAMKTDKNFPHKYAGEK
jgi:hypothetical protein